MGLSNYYRQENGSYILIEPEEFMNLMKQYD